mmetsp:Transcript_19554/g.55113  ORF Transcript_19554/g.55113 Transcript_19554/m.55113 type:complete len:243 (-) Transcript_19554:208-936(-)
MSRMLNRCWPPARPVASALTSNLPWGWRRGRLSTLPRPPTAAEYPPWPPGRRCPGRSARSPAAAPVSGTRTDAATSERWAARPRWPRILLCCTSQAEGSATRPRPAPGSGRTSGCCRCRCSRRSRRSWAARACCGRPCAGAPPPRRCAGASGRRRGRTAARGRRSAGSPRGAARASPRRPRRRPAPPGRSATGRRLHLPDHENRSRSARCANPGRQTAKAWASRQAQSRGGSQERLRSRASN